MGGDDLARREDEALAAVALGDGEGVAVERDARRGAELARDVAEGGSAVEGERGAAEDVDRERAAGVGREAVRGGGEGSGARLAELGAITAAPPGRTRPTPPSQSNDPRGSAGSEARAWSSPVKLAAP